jgi:HK97 family phage prohead protease
MKLNYAITLTAADSNKRTIAGTIVTWGEEGKTSAGRTVFQKNSIDFSKPVKLLLEHDKTRPIGKMSEVDEEEKGIYATFKLAKTFAADDAIEEAIFGIRDGFSVGVMVDTFDNKDGAMVISKSSLHEVSLVSDPAIASAKVESVVATNTPENSEATAEDTTTQEDKVSDTTSDAPIATEAVEAAKSEPVAIQATQPVAYTKPRSPIVDKTSYLEHFLKANVLGDEDSRQYVRAADNTTSTAPGMIPTFQSTQIINALSNGDRGMIDALSRESLVTEGMTFELPKISAVPSVSNVAENAAVTESSLSATFLSVPVQSFKGRAITTVELIDRSRPEYLTALLQQLEFAYAKVTDEFAVGTIAAAGQQTGVNANTAEGFLGYTSAAAGAVYSSSLGFAQNLVVSPGQWTNIMGYNDNGAPLYNAANPSNQAGNVVAGSLRGRVSPGLDLYVSRSIGNAGATTADGDFSMVTINPNAWTWYESPRFNLRTNIQSDGTVDLLYYGYAAIAPKIPFGACWNQT